jgi:hypothetical protein
MYFISPIFLSKANYCLSFQLDDANFDNFKLILQSILRKNSLGQRLPVDNNMLDQYMKEYINTAKQRLQAKNMKSNQENQEEHKRAACGNLNGNIFG